MADVGSINKVILLGYLGKDPELKTNLNTSGKFCILSVATREYFKTKDGEKREPTTWHRCLVGGKAAEVIAKYAKAGTLVAIDGKLKRVSWESKEGDKRQNTQVLVDTITIVGGKLQNQPVGEEPPEENPEEDEIGPEEKDKDDPY